MLIQQARWETSKVKRRLNDHKRLNACLALKLQKALNDGVREKQIHEALADTLQKQLHRSVKSDWQQTVPPGTAEAKSARYWMLEAEKTRALLKASNAAFKVHNERTLAREEEQERLVSDLRQEVEVRNEFIKFRDTDLDMFGIEIKEQYELMMGHLMATRRGEYEGILRVNMLEEKVKELEKI